MCFADDESYSGFPEEILGLEKLEYLSLQYQGLVTLPETIKTMSKLNKINLAHNPYLTTVAAAAGELPLKSESGYFLDLYVQSWHSCYFVCSKQLFKLLF